MSNIELKPCPFCGGAAKALHGAFSDYDEVQCQDCFAEALLCYWNSRTALTPQWQPIETAPKDGTEILAWDGRGQATIHWSDGRWSLVYAGWRAEDGDFDGAISWQPLPAPPEVPDGRG